MCISVVHGVVVSTMEHGTALVQLEVLGAESQSGVMCVTISHKVYVRHQSSAGLDP